MSTHKAESREKFKPRKRLRHVQKKARAKIPLVGK